MAAIGLASLRKEFGALLKKHDGTDFRFIVEMLYHSEPLTEDDFDIDVWKAAVTAANILDAADADFSEVYQWGLRGPDNCRTTRDAMFIKHATL